MRMTTISILIFILKIFNFHIGSGQVFGYLESMPSGKVVMIEVFTRDTIAKGDICNHIFRLDYTWELEEHQAISALISCHHEENRMSIAAPIVLDAPSVLVTLDTNGLARYEGSAFQTRYSDFVSHLPRLESQLYDPESGDVNDSILKSMSLVYQQFYLENRSTPYKGFLSLLIADVLDRDFISSVYLKELQLLCNTYTELDETDKIICNTLKRKLEGWTIRKAPDFESMSNHNEKIKLHDLIGTKVIVLDFWASWCGPCIKEMPELKRIMLEKEVEIVGISIDDRKEPWLKSLGKLDLPWINIWDGDKRIKELYEVPSVPTKFVINKNGVITSKNPKDLALEIDKAND